MLLADLEPGRQRLPLELYRVAGGPLGEGQEGKYALQGGQMALPGVRPGGEDLVTQLVRVIEHLQDGVHVTGVAEVDESATPAGRGGWLLCVLDQVTGQLGRWVTAGVWADGGVTPMGRGQQASHDGAGGRRPSFSIIFFLSSSSFPFLLSSSTLLILSSSSTLFLTPSSSALSCAAVPCLLVGRLQHSHEQWRPPTAAIAKPSRGCPQ